MNSYLFVNNVEIYKFKAKYSEINPAPLWLDNVSEDFSTDNTKKNGLYRYVNDFSVDNDSIDVYVDINKYLMKKYNIK